LAGGRFARRPQAVSLGRAVAMGLNPCCCC
jgi:hypothetical protein